MAINVTTYGAVGNGTTDDTSAIQSALNAAAASATESVVYMPEGIYLISSNALTIPKGISLEGPSFGVGPRFDATSSTWVHTSGATLAITWNGSDKTEDGAAIRMTTGSRIAKLNIWYPNQPVSGAGAVVVYAPTVGLVADPNGANGGNVSRPVIEDVYVSNSYKFVSWRKRHDLGLIDRVYGTAIHTFIDIDQAYDVDRLLNVHTNPNAAYQGAWASNGIFDRQHAQADGAMIRLAKADQPYFWNVFGFGFSKGLFIVDNGSGSANGLQVMQSGWEGCKNPIQIAASTEALMFSQIVLGDSSILQGYGGGRAILIAPPLNTFCNNISFEQVKIFHSLGPAIEAYRVKGLYVTDSYLENILTADGFLRGAVEATDVSRLTFDGNNVKVSGGQIIMANFNNVRGFNVRDNFYDGQAPGGTSFMAVAGSQAGRGSGNLIVNGSGASASPYIASSTDVVIENGRFFNN